MKYIQGKPGVWHIHHKDVQTRGRLMYELECGTLIFAGTKTKESASTSEKCLGCVHALANPEKRAKWLELTKKNRTLPNV